MTLSAPDLVHTCNEDVITLRMCDAAVTVVGRIGYISLVPDASRAFESLQTL